MIHARVLGPLEITVDGQDAPPELLWRKHAALLVYLLRSPDHKRARDQLIGLLWDEKTDDAARHSLNEAVRILRKHTNGRVERDQQFVTLEDGAVTCDVDSFDAAFTSGDYPAAAGFIAGEFLEGFTVTDAWPFEEWLAQERRYWRERCVTALTNCATELLMRGDNGEAMATADRALRLDASAEAAARVGMTARAVLGDRAAALQFYDAFAKSLADNIGADPDPKTEQLVERIRNERAWRVQQSEAGMMALSRRRAPLVGVQQQLKSLFATWSETATSARAGLIVIEGDAGTGKTRLLEELAVRVRLDGGQTLSVRAVPGDAEQPVSGLQDLLSQEVIKKATQEQPLCIIIDDAHWLAVETQSLLGTLLRDLAMTPVLFCLSVAAAQSSDELDNLRARIGRSFPGIAVKTGKLTTESLRALSEWWFPDYDIEQIDRVTRRIAADSAGQPFLAVELLHAIANGLDIGGSHRVWPEPQRTFQQTMPAELPDAIVAALRVSFRKLTPQAQSILAALSVLGERVSADDLARATSQATEDGLDELEWQRWVVAEPRGYSFSARIARDVVARDMVTDGQRHRITSTVSSISAS